MKRREVLKNMMLATSGILTLPSWAIGWKADEMARMNTTFTDYEITIISSIVDLIIPSNGEIGALSVGVDQYLVGLISRCYEESFRGNIRSKLYQLDNRANDTFKKSFLDCDIKEQTEIFVAMKSNENDEDFFNFMKSQTIRGFETSEEVMVNYHGFVLMPGFYDGNVDLEAK